MIDTSSKLDVDFSILRDYQSIKLNRNIKAGKIAVADLNGDGIYDYIIRTPEKNVDPGMPGTLDGSTYQIEAYLSDGTFYGLRFRTRYRARCLVLPFHRIRLQWRWQSRNCLKNSSGNNPTK